VSVRIVPIGSDDPGAHVDALARFFADLPEGDRTFVKEDVGSSEAVRGWLDPKRQWLALDGDRIVGFLAVLPLHGWSDHVGEIRLVVHPGHRGAGLGRTLARHALREAVGRGLSKVVVEVVADQEALLAMFTGLGFTGEALLRDHVRDRTGALRDLVLLAHHVDDTWSAMRTVGLAEELAGGQ
jgi:ribosomal protein S18 acetylase RimI-like enzyme